MGNKPANTSPTGGAAASNVPRKKRIGKKSPATSTSIPPANPTMACTSCAMQMYIPTYAVRFKCPNCAMLYNADIARTALGIICGVHKCTCKCFKGRQSTPAKALPKQNGNHTTRGVTKRPVGIGAPLTDSAMTKSSVGETRIPPPLATVCIDCGHKRSQHAITEKEMNRKQITVPPEWITQDWTIACRHQVSGEMRKLVQELMDSTWKNVITRDRDGARGVSKFEPVQVLRNQNADVWKRYVLKRDVIRAESKQTRRSSRPSLAKAAAGTRLVPKTDAFYRLAKKRGLMFSRDALQCDINEMFLFHGTKPSAALSICDNDFSTAFTGSNKGTLYGHGIYFAESSTKSDEYAMDDPDGAYQGLYATLLCRVVMGTPLINEEKAPDTRAILTSLQSGEFHSVVGDREKIRNTFREFVVFDRDQVYPEFMIIYRRVDGEGNAV